MFLFFINHKEIFIQYLIKVKGERFSLSKRSEDRQSFRIEN